jgi:dipeptidyl aminopeptidase/acylaminoacyl peptidase
MRDLGIPVVLLAAIALPWSVQAQKYDPHDLPRLPGAKLLVEGYFPERFLLTTEDKTLTLQEDAIGLEVSPSISTDGSIVASAHRLPGDLSRAPRLMASTYSVKDGKWTDHPEFEDVWRSVAISPDGSKLACVTRDEQLRVLDLPHFRLRALDLRTGEMTVITESSGAIGPGLSWSPDGRRMVFQMEPPDRPVLSQITAVYVADLESGKISQIALGKAPSWSPSGEWIAFISYIPEDQAQSQPSACYAGRCYAINDHQVSLTSPIGTHTRILMGFHSDVLPSLRPVWSSGSQTLLVNKSRDPDNGTFDIYMLDIVTGKTTKKFKNTAPVYAWVEAK